MNEEQINELTAPDNLRLPKPQVLLLWAILIGYPAVSIIMNLSGSTDPSSVVSRISQVYLPSLIIQCLMISVVWVVLRRTYTDFGAIGLSRNDINWSNMLSGIIFFIGAGALMIIIKISLERSGLIPEKNIFYLLPVTISEKTVWVLLSLGAALAEEITFRGYAVSRLKIITGNYWAGVVLSSAAFSLGHLYQGIGGILLTFLYGMLFAGLYVARGSIFPCIVAHFLQDVMILAAFTPN